MMSSSKVSTFQCPYCSKSLRLAAHYVSHISLSHGHLKNNFPCPYIGCVKSFRAASSIKSHLYRCHEESNKHGFKIVICPCGMHINYSKEEFIKHIAHDITLLGNVNCPIKHCNHTYINQKSFRTHMYRHHNNWQEWVLKEHFKFSFFNSSQNSNTHSIVDVEVPLLTESSVSENINDDVDYNVYLSRLALKMEVKLKMSQTAISEILNDISNLLLLNSNIKLDNLKSLIESRSDLDVNEIILNCKKSQTNIESALSGGILSTAYKRKAYISNNPNFSKVKPVEYCAGTRRGLQRFYTYIPVLEVLTQLLNHDSVLSDILQVLKPVPNLFRSFSDGQSFHKNELFSCPDITLQL